MDYRGKVGFWYVAEVSIGVVEPPRPITQGWYAGGPIKSCLPGRLCIRSSAKNMQYQCNNAVVSYNLCVCACTMKLV